MNLSSTYRKDIDGLRALAIIPVVIFHAFPNLLPGGFIGVDIFFVISGYLISRILISQLETNTFSIKDFYAHRIRRIFPALLLVLFFTLLVGLTFSTPDELTKIGNHIAKSALFMQNFQLLSEIGYFDTESSTKPLLHLWSLAIEEQFYFAYPILLFCLWRQKKRLPVALTLTVIAGASLIACVIHTPQNASEAFYLPHYRMWELMSGGILAIMTQHATTSKSPKKVNHAQSIAGLAILSASLITITKTDGFPGWQALIPVSGAVLIINAGPSAWVNKHLLSQRPIIWAGLISYPFYLWHWPLISFLNVTNNTSTTNNLIAIALSVTLAWGTYKFLEQPIRRRRASPRLLTSLCLMMVATAVTGHQVRVQHGLPNRDFIKEISGQRAKPKAIKHLKNACSDWHGSKDYFLSYCLVDRKHPPRGAIIGDSKAISLSQGLLELSDPSLSWLLLGGANGSGSLVPIISQHKKWADNQKHIANAITEIKAHPSIELVVIVSAIRNIYQIEGQRSISTLQHSDKYLEIEAERGLNAFIDEMLSLGKKIIIVADNPTLQDMGRCTKRTIDWENKSIRAEINQSEEYCSISLTQYREQAKRYHSLLDRIKRRHPDDIRIFDLPSLLCDQSTDRCDHMHQGQPMYSYTDHISNEASRMVTPHLRAMAFDLLNDPSP